MSIKKIIIIIASLLLIPLFIPVATNAALTTFLVTQGGTGTSTLPVSQLLYGSGVNPIQSVATTTASCSGNASCTAFTVIGSSPVTISATGGGGTGSGTVSTSTNEIAGRLPYWTSNSATPALLGQVATTSVTAGTGISFTGTPGSLVGGTNLTIGVSGVPISSLSNYDWTFGNTYNAVNITASTSIPVWVKGQLNASSTSMFDGLLTFGNATGSQATLNTLFAKTSAGLQIVNGSNQNVALFGPGGAQSVTFSDGGTFVGNLAVGNASHSGDALEVKGSTADGSTALIHGQNSTPADIFQVLTNGNTKSHYFTATSTSIASTFPYASTTMITSDSASTSALTVSGVASALLSAVNGGVVSATTVNSPLNWSNGTLACPTCNTSSLSGSGATNQLTYWGGTNALTGSANFIVDAPNGHMAIGTSTPYSALTIWGNGTGGKFFEIADTASTTLFEVNSSGIASTSQLIDSNALTLSYIPSGSVLSAGPAGAIGGKTLAGGLAFSGNTLTISNNGLSLGQLPQIAANTVLGNLTGATANVTAFATSSLGINLSDVTGNLTVSHLNSGSGASASTFWRGDGTWAAAATSLIGGSLTKGNFLVGDDSGASQATSTIFVSSTGQIGIGSTTPNATLSIGTNASLAETPNYPATSTAMSLGMASSTYQVISLGTSATTITFSAYQIVPGMHTEIQTCNPGSLTGGAVTWAAPTGYVLSASGGSAVIPGSTTQAGTCDLWDWQVMANKLASTTGEIILRGMTPSIP